MNFGPLFISRCKKIVEVVFRIDPHSVRIAQYFGAIIKISLDVSQSFGKLIYDLSRGLDHFLFHGLVAPGESDGAGGKITRTDLDANGNSAFDPVPVFGPSSDV